MFMLPFRSSWRARAWRTGAGALLAVGAWLRGAEPAARTTAAECIPPMRGDEGAAA